LREAFPEKKQKVKKLGVALLDEVSEVHSNINKLLWDRNSRKNSKATLCSSRKYPYLPHRRDWNFLVGGL